MENNEFISNSLEEKSELISAIQEIVLAFTGAFDLDTLLQKIIEIFVAFSNSDRGSIFMHKSSTQRLVMSAMYNYYPELRFKAYYSTNVNTKKRIGLTTLAFIDSKTLVINSNEDIKSHPSHNGKYVPKEHQDKGTDCNALVCIPLKNSKQEPFGVLKLENIIRVNNLDDQEKTYTTQNIKDLEFLIEIVSKSIQNFESQSSKIDNSINEILSKVLKSNATGNLSEELGEIVKTFQEVIKNANNVSIWLKEESKLVCKSAVGYSDKLVGQYYELPQTKKRIQNIKKGKEKIGLTPWILISEKMINIKNHEELINHPQYKGSFNHILYPDDQDKLNDFSQSFIGMPLKVGDKIIGVIKADTSRKGNFFSSEEEQILTNLSVITAIIVERDKQFKLAQRRDTQLISLYRLGTECYEMESINNIFWHLLVGLTHGDGIGYNRAILFKLIEKNVNSIIVNGLFALGPKNKNEGKKIKKHFENNVPMLDDSKEFSLGNHPTPELQNFISGKKYFIDKECEFSNFISQVTDEKKSDAQLININNCSNTLDQLIRKDLETYNGHFLAFSIVDSESNVWIGICDNVYSNLTQHDEFTINATNIFVKQISLAVSRLSLKKTNKEIEEEAWQEFTKITAHRIGTETSIMSGALSFLKKSLSNYLQGNKYSEKKDLITLENSLNHLKKAVQEYTELTKPPTIDLKPVQLSDILNAVLEDIKPLQEAKNNDNQYYINNSNVEIIDEYPNELPIILGDKEALLYVFKELIDNAITEMSEGGELGISSSVFPDEYLIIKIKDSGIGINPNYFKKIFELGFRDRPGGTGLGLHIVKKYIESHKGEVWVKNNRENWSEDDMVGGACFCIKFPIHKAKIERILIVEDTSRHAEHLTRSIEYLNSKIKIDLAENEHQAIELLNQQIQKTKINPYDFIIADVNLAEKRGSEYGGINFLEYLKSNNITAKVIIVTAHAGMEITDSLGHKKGVFERAKELGAYACISRNQQENYLDEINKIIST